MTELPLTPSGGEWMLIVLGVAALCLGVLLLMFRRLWRRNDARSLSQRMGSSDRDG